MNSYPFAKFIKYTPSKYPASYTVAHTEKLMKTAWPTAVPLPLLQSLLQEPGEGSAHLVVHGVALKVQVQLSKEGF